MAKSPRVTINETPSEQLVKDALKEVVVPDRRGRKIKLAKPSTLAQFRLVKVLGGEAAANQVYMGMILPLIFVTAIDDDPVYFPNNEREVDALIQRLDEDGIAAVAIGVQENWGEANTEADKTALKK